MSREHIDFDPLMMQLNTQFPGRELLTIDDVKQFTGYKTRDSVKKHYPFAGGRIKKVTLARLMCKEA